MIQNIVIAAALLARTAWATPSPADSVCSGISDNGVACVDASSFVLCVGGSESSPLLIFFILERVLVF